MAKLIEIAAAIFDEYRLQVIKLLQTREMCVCELAAALNLSSSRISQHLAILKRNKIVKERRDGKWIYYSLLPKTIEGFNKSWKLFLEANMDSAPEMRNVIKRLQKLNLADVRKQCATKKVANIKLKKEGTTNGD